MPLHILTLHHQNFWLRQKLFIFIYSANIALNFSYYKDSMAEFRIWNVSNNIDIWLASISQTRTWNCVEACKYWLVNNLYLRNFSKSEKIQYECFNWTDMVTSPKKILGVMAKELGTELLQEVAPVPGVLQPCENYEAKLINDAKILRKIYSDNPLFKLADSFEEWHSAALEDRTIVALLEEYAQFWNSTGHTNFDWVGPIAERIINMLHGHCNDGPSNHNYSYEFYHIYFQINSDNYSEVQANLEHYLGSIEDKIHLPLLPYYLRVAIAYLKSVAQNYIFHAHSYLPMKRTSIYKRLTNESTLVALKRVWLLIEEFEQLEILIEKAETTCAHLKTVGFAHQPLQSISDDKLR